MFESITRLYWSFGEQKITKRTTSLNTRSFHLAIILIVNSVMIAASPEKSAPKEINISAGRFAFAPNEITIKKGEPVMLLIHSTDVTHGLVIEDLGVRTNIKKGQTATVTFTPDTAGTFQGKCAHFCGKGHGSMTLIVHVVE
jgi:cytochrome c oxidase subunit II